MKKLIIFPDIHGRKFWKEPFEAHKNDEDYGFIFLGDYLDAYGFEKISNVEAIDNFKDILESTIDHPRVIRLVGNHDIHYLPPLDKEYGCRRYDFNKQEIQKLFLDNLDKFQVCHIEKIKDTRYVFSHAGFLKKWITQAAYGINLEITLDNANDLLLTENGLWALSMYGFERGAFSRQAVGSCVWADIYEHLDLYDRRFEDDVYQIFAHNQSFPDYEDLSQYYIDENFAMLDAQKPFILDLETGELKEYEQK